MARRVVERELLNLAGITSAPIGPNAEVEIVKESNLHVTFNGIFCLQFNYKGDVLAAGYGGGGVQLFDPKTGELTSELQASRQGGFAVMVLRFHPKETHILYAGTAEGHISIYDTIDGIRIALIEEPGNEINALDFCVDGFNYVTGGRDLHVRVYETRTNKIIKTYEGGAVADSTKLKNTMRIFCIKFHPNNQFIFISGGWDNHVKIWDVRDNEGIKRNIRGPHICGESLDMRGNRILTGQWTALHALQELDYTSGKSIQEIVFPHTDGAFLYAAQYINDKMVIAGGSGTNRAHVIEIGTNKNIGGYTLPGPVHSVDSALDGRCLAVGGGAGKFAILRLKD